MKCEDSRELFSRQTKIRGFLLYMRQEGYNDGMMILGKEEDKMLYTSVIFCQTGKWHKSWNKREQGWKV